jgi:hypothetical protein
MKKNYRRPQSLFQVRYFETVNLNRLFHGYIVLPSNLFPTHETYYLKRP